ncbi:MAG TPA: HAD family hydrolase [Gemmatimonadaceae bacterium]
MTPPRPAAFLDRDGTIIVDVDYPSRPEQVRLLPGAAAAVRRLNECGIPAIVVTNQSGIARGFVTESDYERVRARLDELLADEGARLDASYHCPHHPDFDVACDCRKPGTGMHERAARELGLDLARSLYVGDRLRDLLPAAALGGRGILVVGPSTPDADRERAERDFETARSLAEAVERLLAADAGRDAAAERR